MATDKVAYWTDIADYDLDTAEAMYQTGRWLIDNTKQLQKWIKEQL